MTALDDRLDAHLDHCPREGRQHFLALAMAGEAGEAANEEKKAWRDGTNRDDKLLAEMIDNAAYTLMLARHLGISVTQFLTMLEVKLIEVEGRPDYQNYGRGS